MTKPIFVIRMNSIYGMDAINNIRYDLNKNMPGLVKDYHIVFASGDNKHIEFECFNPDNLPADVKKSTMQKLLDIINSYNKNNHK